jgi:adenylate cyclase
MWALTLRSSDGEPIEYIIRAEKTTIGRRPENDIVIADLSASRVHAEFQFDESEDNLVVLDLGSTNGTYVNHMRLQGPRQLNHNDVVRIGEHVLHVIHQGGVDRPTSPVRGTQILTRDIVLESIDMHAVLMYEVARKLNTVLDIDTALREVSGLMQRTLAADRCELILSEQFDQLAELGFPTSIARSAIENRAAVNIPDISRDGSAFHESAMLMRVRSVLCVPVIGGDKVIGLVYMYKTDPTKRPFDERDFQLAVAISHQAALTIQRMRLLERVREEQRVRQLLQRFVSPGEAEFIFQHLQTAGSLPGLSERRVSCVFADIADSTGMAERLGPKGFGSVLSRYYQEMTDIVFANNGLIDKYLGDGIMAVFGMTGNQQEHEERAVRAGLAMIEKIEIMNQELHLPELITVGVGVNTGDVVAGYMGTKQRVELTVLGDTVNVAAGLQVMARPNRVFVGPATMAAIVGKFATRRVGPIVVKGRTRNIQAHEVLKAAVAEAQ